MRYLSDDWLRAADQALAGLDPLDDDVSVGFVVTSGTDEEEISYRLVLGSDRVGYQHGVTGAGVVLVLDRDLAVEISRGDTSAQRAFLDGRLRLRGDVNLLLGHARALAAFEDRLAELRSRTEY